MTGEAPLIQTDTSSLGNVIDQTNVSTLPLNQRNWVSFTYLVPGAQFHAEGSIDSTQGLALSVNGARETANNFLIDGIDDNDLVINQYSAIPSLDAIQEFKVQSGNYTAEYGRSGGAQVNVALKSGSNQFHGTAFEFLRNRHMDAKNYFDRPDCTPALLPGTCGPIPNLDRSQFGGSFGGPIVRNKTFFFADFEYLDQRRSFHSRGNRSFPAAGGQRSGGRPHTKRGRPEHLETVSGGQCGIKSLHIQYICFRPDINADDAVWRGEDRPATRRQQHDRRPLRHILGNCGQRL